MTPEEQFKVEQQTQQNAHNFSDNEIKNIKLNLPDKTYYEFLYYMFFKNKFKNLEQEWNNWTGWKIWDYPIDDLNRFNQLIISNKSKIKDKKILDIGCSLGYFALFCLNLNCKSIEGVDVRENKLELAKFICDKAGFKNYNFSHMNTYDQNKLLEKCKNKDTILLLGILCCVPNHYSMLSTLTKSNAKCIIIDNTEIEQFYQNPNPHICWNYEDVSDSETGFIENQNQVFVGTPNQRWIDSVMHELGWEIEKINYYKMKKSKKTQLRCNSVYVR